MASRYPSEGRDIYPTEKEATDVALRALGWKEFKYRVQSQITKKYIYVVSLYPPDHSVWQDESYTPPDFEEGDELYTGVPYRDLNLFRSHDGAQILLDHLKKDYGWMGDYRFAHEAVLGVPRTSTELFERLNPTATEKSIISLEVIGAWPRDWAWHVLLEKGVED